MHFHPVARAIFDRADLGELKLVELWSIAEQKARLIKGVSELLLEVLNKPLDSTFVTIQEIELENWGWGGLPVPELRRQRTGRAKTSD